MAHLVVLESAKEDLFVCGCCKSVFTNLSLFIDHKREGCSTVNYQNNETTSLKPSQEHVTPETSESRNQNNAPPVKTDDSLPHNITCKLCKKPFKKLKSLLVHIKSHSGKPYQCQICGRCFGHNSHLQRHENSHRVWPLSVSETTAKSKDVDALSYCCSYCDKVLTNYSQFRIHLKKHLSIKQFKCVQPDCIRLFETVESLLEHTSNEHKQPLYTCHICSEQFWCLESIASHQQSHNEPTKVLPKESSYKCSQCDACFKSQDKLSLHLSIDNHKKRCIYCNKSFASDKRLRLHLQIHNKVKPFSCNVCGQSFHMKKYLSMHLLKHGEKQFPCSVCHQKFKRKDLLQRHYKLHQNRSKLMCPFKETFGCTMEFTRNDKLKLHMRQHTKHVALSMSDDRSSEHSDNTSLVEILIVPLDES